MRRGTGRHRQARIDAEDYTRAGTAAGGHAVKLAIIRLDQSGLRLESVGVAEAVENREHPLRSDGENGADAVRAAAHRRAVEVAVGGLDHARVRFAAIEADNGRRLEAM